MRMWLYVQIFPNKKKNNWEVFMDNFENYDATDNDNVEENPILRLNANDMADICHRLWMCFR